MLRVAGILWGLLIGVPVMAGEMVTIPAGAFMMGCSPGDTHCAKDEKPRVKVQVPAFMIDAREVTVADYRACEAAGKCAKLRDHRKNEYCTYGRPGRESHPLICVDWEEARAYCAAVGKRLPREAEWEKAARAGTTRAYAVKNPSCKNYITNDGKTAGSVKGELDGCGEDRTWPVGSRAPNALGLYDMFGNAGEWVANGYAPDALQHYAKGDLDYFAKSEERVIRGSSWDEKIINIRASFRNSKSPVSGELGYGSVGFRCAQDIK